jgi:hypothetical protein
LGHDIDRDNDDGFDEEIYEMWLGFVLFSTNLYFLWARKSARLPKIDFRHTLNLSIHSAFSTTL